MIQKFELPGYEFSFNQEKSEEEVCSSSERDDYGEANSQCHNIFYRKFISRFHNKVWPK